MRKFLHRFYDLNSGGAEVVMLSFIRAFPEDRHILVFNKYEQSWLSKELQSLPHVVGIQIKGRDFTRIVVEQDPDLLFWHWYPPMSIDDFSELSESVLKRSILYNHWFTEVPDIDKLRAFWFVTPTSLAESGRCIPPEKACVVLNPVRAEFFDVHQRTDAMRSVGRHSRPVGIKFSTDFFPLYEGIPLPDLQVMVLGCDPALVAFAQSQSSQLKHTYWLLPSNSMPTTRFLSFLRVFVYKTHDSFRESCCVSILEALAAGIPVVAENKGGIRDLVISNETGMLCDSLDDYHREVHGLLTDEDKWQKYALRARQWAWENVSPMAYRNKCEKLIVP
jgi:glycosyltransferase involved in cell wall biosynthesis